MEHYLIAMAVTAGIYALMALGMNVIWGMAGLINLGLVGFFAVGAYVSGAADAEARLADRRRHRSPARAVAALVGVLVALITVRLRGDYLAIVTLGFAETMRIVCRTRSGSPTAPTASPASPARCAARSGRTCSTCSISASSSPPSIVLFFLVDRLGACAVRRACCARFATTSRSPQVAGKNVVLFKVKAFALRHARRSASPARSTGTTPATSRPTSSCRC